MDRAPVFDAAAEDAAAPDSWEMADLDEAMNRLLLSTKKDHRPAVDFDEEVAGDAALPSAVEDFGEGSYCDEFGMVDPFLREALEKPRERLSILRMEQDIEKFILNQSQQELEFEGLPTSYLRLAAHRVAQHYSLQSVAFPDNSTADGFGSRIVLRKSTECRFPPIRLANIPVELPKEENNNVVKVAIKQRPQHRSGTSSLNSHSSKAGHQKSVEERKEEYNRARARIFNSNDGGAATSSARGETKLPNYVRHGSLMQGRLEEKPVADEYELTLGRNFVDDLSIISRNDRTRAERVPIAGRYKAGNRVAIFRDRDVDRKDPDYDRNYDRYMQRFDPGFGFSGGTYAVQPMYSPAVNYNTEFPQLGTCPRTPISIDHQVRPNPQHLRDPWSSGSSSSQIGYGHTDGMVAPFNPNHAAAHTSSMFIQSQYPATPLVRVPFVHSHDHVRPFSQDQTESSFGFARPR